MLVVDPGEEVVEHVKCGLSFGSSRHPELVQKEEIDLQPCWMEMCPLASFEPGQRQRE